MTGLLVVLTTTLAVAEVVLVENRLTLDAVAWANARWQRVSEGGVSQIDFSFYRFGAPVGLNFRPAPGTAVRVSFDAGWNERALDLYVDFRLPAGLLLRAGQFIPPIGHEALTLPQDLKAVEYSLLKGAWKPYDPRDVGLMLARDSGLVAASIAFVNGFGRSGWLQDENKWKDISGRLLFRPAFLETSFIGGRGYYGRMGPDGGLMVNYALELGFGFGGLVMAAEIQHALIGAYGVTAGYAQTAYRAVDWLELVGRLQGSLDVSRTWALGVTAGANVELRGDAMRLMVNYDYLRQQSRQSASLSERNRVLLQLQASL
ncbi:MAG: hypothetical protein R6W83_08255 [Cryobacterium sp.]